MNIKEFKAYAILRLKDQYEPPGLQLFISTLLQEMAEIPGHWYYTKETYVPHPEKLKSLMFAVDQAAAGKPLQYILGQVVFGGCSIKVDRRVLIPRPETEQLWDKARRTATGPILDACTGSGCLAVALKKEKPQVPVFAFDINPNALELARENAVLNKTDVCFFQADIADTDAVEAAAIRAGLKKGTTDLLVSNPPYVTEKEKEQMLHRVLAFEPAEALFVPDADPLVHYRPLALLGSRFLRPGGTLLAEVNEAYGEELRRLFVQSGYSEVLVEKDLNEKDRFIHARWVP
ncbi:MAG: peptide chain release factor N(5)-glutamine methyltransferase [Bacteroidales bacterium]|jgi:release factor glutamine methyltransferase|nr:peptide chain release factor N(5)-glutamine methyltransferase [Bacteroidales bacterium]HKM30915.1 peptide chain release factor N(5)-glutamine methyltransferase [Bacteroidales bacterium]HPX79438.1 peptide chain release factor N(5)-glutamine methyltransferase [Bacteroidales bacterium]